MNDIDYYKDEVHCLYAEKKELQERINKAIEYIENNSLYHEEYSDNWDEENYLAGVTDEKESKELLDILKGSDSNE